MSKQTRQWILGGILIMTGLLVWWFNMYEPLRVEFSEVQSEIDIAMQKYESLEKKIKKYSDFENENNKAQKTLVRFANLMINGNSIEEINAGTQIHFQKFLEKNDILIKQYKVLSPEKWRQYSLSRVQFHLNTSMQGLADLLEYIETLEKVIRVERLVVNYQKRNKGPTLSVELYLGTLFIEKLNLT